MGLIANATDGKLALPVRGRTACRAAFFKGFVFDPISHGHGIIVDRIGRESLFNFEHPTVQLIVSQEQFRITREATAWRCRLRAHEQLPRTTAAPKRVALPLSSKTVVEFSAGCPDKCDPSPIA
jgi:hypothetical protein